MKSQVTTIGDAMKDIFIFPSMDEMKKPVSGAQLNYRQTDEKFLILGYGDKITITDTFEDIGGTACNTAVSFAKLGLKSSIVTCCGKDQNGEEILSKLRQGKVDISNIDIKSTKKSSFSVIISYKGDRSILVYHSFGPKDFSIPKDLQTDWLYVGPVGDDYDSLFSKITGLAAEKNIQIAFNPGSVQLHDGLHRIAGLLSVTKVIFLNREEAQLLSGLQRTATIKEISKIINQKGPETVVITDGPEGAYAYSAGEFFKIGSYPGHRVEATGAGDAFASAFLTARIKGEDLFTSLKWGVTNSASVVGKYGAQQGLLGASTIKSRITEYRWPANSLRFS